MSDPAAEPLTFDRIAVGLEFPPVADVLTAETLARWGELTGDPPLAGPDGGPPLLPLSAWPLILTRAVFRAIPNRPPGGIHAGQTIEYLAPIAAGDRLETVVRVVEKYERRGRNYVIQATTTRNQRGETVARGTMTSVWAR